MFVSILALIWQRRKLNRQRTLRHFSEYTKRYQDIILQFPQDINRRGFVLTDREDYGQRIRRMHAYFDLCFEQWYLYRKRLINAKVWRPWKEGMTTAMSRKVFQQAWEIVRDPPSAIVLLRS